MKHTRLLLFLICLLGGTFVHGQTAPTLTEADYERAAAMLDGNLARFVDGDIDPKWLPDNRLWYQLLTEDKAEFKLFDPATKKWVTADTKAALFEKAAAQPEPKRPSRDEVVSPDGKYIAFIRDWNLWVRDSTSGKEMALTTDGVKDFGYATDNAGWKHSDRPILSWSPDSKKIATFQQDQRHVQDMYLVETKVGAPELQAWKYPLPGDSAIIQIHRVIIDLTTGKPKMVRLKMGPDARRGTLCDDIACDGTLGDVEWSEDGKQLAFVSTSRDHKEAHVRIANTETGAVRDVFEEIVDTQYESGQGTANWSYLSGSNEIIWYSERSDWGHLYLYDATSGQLKNQITSGDYVVRQVLHVDEKARVVYFIASGREGGNPYYRYLYRVNLNGRGLTLLTPETGDHAVQFSPNHQYFLDAYSQPDVPPIFQVKNTKGKQIATLEKTDLSRLQATGWQPPTPFSVRSADDRWDLYGLLYTPTDLDSTKTYPVIVYIYPGPQGGSVRSWSFQAGRRDNQALAELGFVVMELEGSCNPNRSKSFHDACYGDMSQNTLPDQVAGLRQLANRYAFLDLDRVGIWGHSGGGFATVSAMFKYPDFFKVGIAESGNHDNRNYEDDWGERYVGLEVPAEQGNTNYGLQANQLYAKDLKGDLLLVHGGLDDNVPPYNSYLVADALIKANKDFDMLVLPNARHGYGKDSYYMMRRRWDYFVEHLMHATPPDAFEITIQDDPRIKSEESE
ncbi:Dipeptidyl aminopeptidase/acylaminoacyl peptidase [Catalinimonas alkaloidigena]|uniref:Dipeptidyl aminopeptidase/acylaminoacyl peptidase n=1 Tax=Catalinimonas alkaloidigena TaxID=1075417 RepID=A0A1G9G840_9BACT|nr:DPP IV N-terminal domain-containing protein [Catalinimonas alkaloidigena]SDK96453.1 Dipeptidyl aminopeptidase/acylaminoacyl peptidase [Catalinimonas alkaloidigena]